MPLVKFLGLPAEAAVAFLFGFFRRDYGAAGLYDLQHSGGMGGNQLLVATVVLTIFLPCIAQFLIMRKERGWGVTLAMSGAILATAFGVGWLSRWPWPGRGWCCDRVRHVPTELRRGPERGSVRFLHPHPEGCGKVKCPYCGYENQRPSGTPP